MTAPTASSRALGGAAAVGAMGVAAAYFTQPHERFWANWLLWSVFLVTVGLGSLFLVGLEHLVGARWSVPLRRVPERLSGLLLVAGPATLVALAALPVLYPWARPEAAKNHAIAMKAAWLNVPFFSARAVACLALWALAYWVLVRGSMKQDRTGDPAFTARARRFAPVYMVIFAFTITLVAFDWISSLEPEWYSDIFGVYLFAGSFLAGLAATSLAVVYLKDRDRLAGITPDHMYNLGAFLFAFTVFWSYIGFAQYMLMWYGDMPEEIFWYKQRLQGGWLTMILVVAFIHFFVPFFALVPRGAKRNYRRVRWVAALMLAAHFLDLYWMIMPAVGKSPVFSWPEASFAFLFLGGSLLWVRRSMGQGEDMPVGDPFLQEGLEFHL